MYDNCVTVIAALNLVMPVGLASLVALKKTSLSWAGPSSAKAGAAAGNGIGYILPVETNCVFSYKHIFEV